MTTISFMNDMILAYQAGLKTQTRRVIQKQPPVGWRLSSDTGMVYRGRTLARWESSNGMWTTYCPYGQPGDLLGFLEGYQIVSADTSTRNVQVRYLADDTLFDVELTPQELAKWERRKYPYRATPGRFMYRSLVRYTPKILSIRVERVQDISDEDILTEGIDPIRCARTEVNREVFSELWDSINSKRGYGWNANPWCWVVEVERNSR